jgi:hypothetical protein
MMSETRSTEGGITLPARKLTVAALGVAALLVATPMSATAKPVAAAAPKLITNKVVAPFNLAVNSSKLLVADGGTSTLSRVLGDGSLRTIANGPGKGGDVAGVAISRNGKYIAYTTTEHPTEEENANGTLHIIATSNTRVTVNLAKYEANHNPDKVNTYGTRSTDPCVLKAVEDAFKEPARYKGQKDSHPYSVTAYGKSSWIVADAGGNDLLKVDSHGRVSTLAVLPPQPVKITKALLPTAPGCALGVTYRFQPVPTDVEVGTDGQLYVTTLPGGPDTGARGSVYRVNPRDGHVKRVATGFAGATNLARYRGKIYVSEFYGGQISTVKNGKAKLYQKLPGVVSIESGRGHLYAGTFASAQGPGTVIRLK